MKDIFVDDCVAVRLENPVDEKLKSFLEWLWRHGTLVVTNKILVEYGASLDAGSSNFFVILNECIKHERILKIDNDQLKALRFSKRVERSLLSNRKDWWHIKAVLLSPRKLALSFDNNFLRDVNGFPGAAARASRSPDDLPYK
ncbi:MAG TPA: hypothetical protein VFH59_13150 [Frateuria sp.]|uniref:hypothetical protein n=1 Tax=Frateuria sp. TaxID=2211372 RepID=UPI002D7F648F|nr:hypothetical protein [Frateuria sp.]HET6806377.1 hypothetical protein [Frateuria sp.]